MAPWSDLVPRDPSTAPSFFAAEAGVASPEAFGVSDGRGRDANRNYMMESRNDDDMADLVARARAGDRPAFESLFGCVAEDLLYFVRLRLGRRLRAKTESMDVVQDVYFEAWRVLDALEFRSVDALRRWFNRLAENRIRGLADHHAAQKRDVPGGLAPVSEILDRVRSSSIGPATNAVERERRRRLHRAIVSLEDDVREMVILRFFEDRTTAEIAELTSRAETTVRRMLAGAVVRLGDMLGESRGGKT